MKIRVLKEYKLGIKPKQVRSCVVNLGSEKGRFFAYCEDPNADPCDSLLTVNHSPVHLAMYGAEGQQLWHRELSLGVIAGIWFMPFIAWDMDGDGIDEIWFVNNLSEHQFMVRSRVLERVDAVTGETIATYPFPADNIGWIMLGEAYRYSLYGGYVHGEPVLVMQQGTYKEMFFQCYNADMTLRWEREIKEDGGVKASHSTPIIDLNDDNIDEVLVGERVLSLDTGEELACFDKGIYNGHSDVVLPFTDFNTGKKMIFTCRETGNYEGCPRIVMYDYQGNKIWQNVYIYDPKQFASGHMHMGYVIYAKPNYRRVAVGIKDTGECYIYDAITGEDVQLPDIRLNVMRPIDINGDGYHEFITWGESTEYAKLFDSEGNIVSYIGGELMQTGKWDGFKGEQLLSFYSDEGVVRMWGDVEADDSEVLISRYNTSFHETMDKMTGNGYNWLSSISCGG